MNKQAEKKQQKPDQRHDREEADLDLLETTDPQEKMKGPVSSMVQNVKEEVEKGDEESQEEATRRKDKNT